MLIRGALAEVLIAEPCINFAGCGEGLSAGEGCGVEQTAREVAVLSRVLWCEFTWLIRLVALAIILGGPFVGVFLDSRAAGRGRGCGEAGDRSICGQPAGAGRLSFSRLLGAFCNDANPT